MRFTYLALLTAQYLIGLGGFYFLRILAQPNGIGALEVIVLSVYAASVLAAYIFSYLKLADTSVRGWRTLEKLAACFYPTTAFIVCFSMIPENGLPTFIAELGFGGFDEIVQSLKMLFQLIWGIAVVSAPGILAFALINENRGSQ